MDKDKNKNTDEKGGEVQKGVKNMDTTLKKRNLHVLKTISTIFFVF